MTFIDYQPVKRCPKCGRLIPENLDTCPYCEGDYTFERPMREPDDETTRVIKPRQPMDPKTKKRILYGIGGAAILGLIIFGIVYIMGTMRLNKSILEPFDADDITTICKDHPDFREQYAIIEQMRDFILEAGLKEEYGDITYKDAIAFIDRVNDEKWVQETVEKASSEFEDKFHKPILSKVKAEEKKWKDYIEEHDPNKYLVVTPHERYVDDDWCWRPGFYFDLEFPKGNIRDCSVHYGLVSDYNNDWDDTCDEWGDLANLRERNVSNDYRWLNVSSYAQDIYDTRHTRVEIQSVTLNDGTVISVDDVENNVPQSARQYINNPGSDDSAFIRECIDSNYPLKSEYVGNVMREAYKKDFPLIFKLIDTEMHKHGYAIDLYLKSRHSGSFGPEADIAVETADVDYDSAYWE